MQYISFYLPLSVFLFSILICLLLILLKPFHIKLSQDNIIGPQKIHDYVIPRIGGIVIFCIFFFIIVLWENSKILNYLLFSSLPVFLSGLIEDFTKQVTAKIRLLSTVVSAILCLILVKHGIYSIGFNIIDKFIENTYLPLIFAFFSIILLTQAFNIIDGLNGFCLFNALIALVSIWYVTNKINLVYFSELSIFICSGLIGLIIFNFPKPILFIGDSGAYALGFLLSNILILLPDNTNISPFFSLAVVIYPIYETLRSFFRRLIVSDQSFMNPDTLHLHSLIYKKVSSIKLFKFTWLNNSFSTVLSLVLPISICIWSCIHFNDRNNLIFGLIIFLIIFEFLIHYLNKQLNN